MSVLQANRTQFAHQTPSHFFSPVRGPSAVQGYLNGLKRCEHYLFIELYGHLDSDGSHYCPQWAVFAKFQPRWAAAHRKYDDWPG